MIPAGSTGGVIKSISVVLPVYNEEGNIADVVKSVACCLASLTDDFEIIAVNDSSIDKTAGILEGLKSAQPRLKVIHHLKNRGYGAALNSGFKEAKKELVLMMDADRQFNIGDISKLLCCIEDFDIVMGLRQERKDSLHRYILGRLANFLMNIIFKVGARDINCGFKLFRAGLLHSLELSSDSGLINTEVVVLARRKKAKIKEVEVSHYPRIYGRQTGTNIKVVIRTFFRIFRLISKLRNDMKKE